MGPPAIRAIKAVQRVCADEEWEMFDPILGRETRRARNAQEKAVTYLRGRIVRRDRDSAQMESC